MTTNPMSLLEESVSRLPLWAQVAFAARCARRVVPHYERSDLQEPFKAAVRRAVQLAERAAAEVRTSEARNAAFTAKAAFDACSDAREAAVARADPSRPCAVVHAAGAAQGAATAALLAHVATLGAVGVANVRGRASDVARTASQLVLFAHATDSRLVALSRAAVTYVATLLDRARRGRRLACGRDQALRHLARTVTGVVAASITSTKAEHGVEGPHGVRALLHCIDADLEILGVLARREGWTHDSPVACDVFGPLWIEADSKA